MLMHEGLFNTALLDKLEAGDESAFRLVYDDMYPQLCYFAMKLLNDRQSAEDVVVDVFISFLKKKQKFNSCELLRSWLFTAVKNRSIDQMRKNRSRHEAHEGMQQMMPPANDTDISQALILSEAVKAIYNEIEHLPPQIKKVILLSFTEGKTVKEIAAELQTAVQTVQNQKARGIQLLKSRIVKNNLFSAATIALCLQIFNRI